ncbi:SRPBCC family protein [Arthrobacter sp. ISL-65]|uniref:SRPBCC family protein n=1 Tax=Arthrobacter sp. ISL-65 TaxID=2819112 RepID=UPI001BEA3D50|nr:SRPBCC family protein [Arthrobacter sp. ISL-65]MBT2550436.1 SRPBCC family protein [Arthrobacter sp. ISL-65]
MQTVEETIEVDVPVRTVYEQWSQFEFFPQFMSGVESVTRVSDRITHWVTNVGGAEREFDAETIEDREDERIAWRSTDGVSHAGAVSFTQLGPRAPRVWVRLEWSPENLAEKTGAALGFDNMQVRADMLRFKEFIESRGTGTDAEDPRR